MRRSGIAGVVALLATVVPAAAQGLKKIVDENAGIELRVPRWIDAIPVKPGDRQTLLQLKGSAEARADWHQGPAELTLLVVRIERQAGPTTGADGAEPDGGKPAPAEPEDMKSMTEMRADAMNKGRTLEEFLERRGYRHDLKQNERYFRKPVTDDRELEYAVHELSQTASNGDQVVLIRAFTTQDEAEIFGLVALGPGATLFEKDVEKVLRSLIRIRTAAGEGDDPYAGSALRDADHRRKVRSRLVDGWRAFDTENFILVTNVSSQKIVDNMLIDLEVMRAAYFERFPPADGADMSKVSTVRLCDGYDDYLRYAGDDLDGTGGYWSPLEEELVLFNPERKIPKARPWLKDVDPVSTLYHEAMHQYFHYSNRQLSPGSWFNEGYGEVFAGSVIDRRKRELKDLKPDKFRMSLIRVERKRAGSPDLRMLVIMPQREFYGAGVLVNYANAWSLCYFLEMERRKPERQRNQAWADLPDVYLKHLREVTERFRARFPADAPDDWIMSFQDEIQREAIELALKTVDEEELEDAWQKAVMKWR